MLSFLEDFQLCSGEERLKVFCLVLGPQASHTRPLLKNRKAKCDFIKVVEGGEKGQLRRKSMRAREEGRGRERRCCLWGDTGGRWGLQEEGR